MDLLILIKCWGSSKHWIRTCSAFANPTLLQLTSSKLFKLSFMSLSTKVPTPEGKESDTTLANQSSGSDSLSCLEARRWAWVLVAASLELTCIVRDGSKGCGKQNTVSFLVGLPSVGTLCC